MASCTSARAGCSALMIVAAAAAHPAAQEALSLQQAVDRALASRPSLKAEAERVSVAEGLRQQAAALPNPEFQFQNENLRPGQTYSRDVDALAYRQRWIHSDGHCHVDGRRGPAAAGLRRDWRARQLHGADVDPAARSL